MPYKGLERTRHYKDGASQLNLALSAIPTRHPAITCSPPDYQLCILGVELNRFAVEF